MADFYAAETPAPVKDAKGLHLITENTPTGKKVQILLEELKIVYGTQWTTSLIDIETDEQKEPWYLRLNPNGKIPLLIDNAQTPAFVVMESHAELLYLQENLDEDNVFGFANKFEQSEAVQWLFFWQTSQPMQSQFGHFNRSAPEKIPYAISRFKTELLRCYIVVELHLSGKYTGKPRQYLVGAGEGKYSIADIGMWPWIRNWRRSFTEEEMAEVPHLQQWVDRIAVRPAVKIGISEFYDSEENLELVVSTKKK